MTASRFAPLPADALGEGLEVRVVAATVAQAHEQVHRALEQRRHDVGPDRKWRGAAQEIHIHRAPAVHRNAVARDDDPLAAIQLLAQSERRGGVERGHLHELYIRGARQPQDAVEVVRVGGVNEHVQLHALVECAERAQHLEIAEVRAQHHDAAGRECEPVHLAPLLECDILAASGGPTTYRSCRESQSPNARKCRYATRHVGRSPDSGMCSATRRR